MKSTKPHWVSFDKALQPFVERWSPAYRHTMATKLERWAKQLRLSAPMLEEDHPAPTPLPFTAMAFRKFLRN